MCDFCKKFDFSSAKCEVTFYGAHIVLGIASTRYPPHEQFNYCPKCGAPVKKVEGNGYFFHN